MAHRENHIDQWDLLNKHFSGWRMRNYLDATRQNKPVAMALFTWNSSTSASLWELIGYVEIALRTRIDFQLRVVNGRGDWLINETVFTREDSIWEVIEMARGRVGMSGVRATHEQILQQLPLGFFQTILSKRYLRLWPLLAEGFIGGNRSSQRKLSLLMVKLRRFRNRVGHHDLLVDLDLMGEFENLLRIAELIDPKLCLWLRSTTKIETQIRAKPKV